MAAMVLFIPLSLPLCFCLHPLLTCLLHPPVAHSPNCSPQYLYQPTSTFSWPDCHCCFMSLPVPARLHLFPSSFLFIPSITGYLCSALPPLLENVCHHFTNKSLNCSCLPQLSAFGSFYLLPCMHTSLSSYSHVYLVIASTNQSRLQPFCSHNLSLFLHYAWKRNRTKL